MSNFELSSNFGIPEISIPEEHFVAGTGGSSKGYCKKAFYQGKWYKISAGTIKYVINKGDYESKR